MNDKGRRGAFGGGQLQAAACGQIKARHFTDDGGKRTRLQPLFHRTQDVIAAPRLGDDQKGGVKSKTLQRIGIKIASAAAPQNRARLGRCRTRRQKRGKGGRQGGILAIGAGGQDFMERTAQKTRPQRVINGGKVKEEMIRTRCFWRGPDRPLHHALRHHPAQMGKRRDALCSARRKGRIG